jgi:serine/threonine-protein kinase
MLYETLRDSDPGDLWYLERSANGGTWEPHLFLQTPFREAGAKISPNGRYAAYVSNESGRNEIYVLPFPNAHRGPRVTVSANGGTKHRWSRDGGELFYVDGEDTMVEVKVSTDAEFTLGTPTRLFQHPGLTWEGDSAPYDVTVDEQRFLLAELIAEVGAAKPMIRVVQSWPKEPQDREQD